MAEPERRLEARSEGRRLHISGMMVPWDSTIYVEGEPESWQRGALDRQMSEPRMRRHVRLDLMHTSHAPAGDGDTIEPFGRLVDSQNLRRGQYGDFRLDRSSEARMAWSLVDDGVLDGFSVVFISVDPPHIGQSRGREGTQAQGRVREAIVDTVGIVDQPAYRAARATAEARRRHPILADLHTAGAGAMLPAEYIDHYRRRQARRGFL